VAVPLSFPHFLLRCLLLGVIAVVCGGCAILGVAASKLPARMVDPAYQDLAGQPTAVVIWADDTVALDYPALARQVGQGTIQNLELARDGGPRSARELLEGVTFPFPPASYLNLLDREPELKTMPTADLAANLAARTGTTRVLLVEIDRFTTRGGAAQGLVRGVLDASISLYEIPDAADAAPDLPMARLAYNAGGVTVNFPPSGPTEGSQTVSPALAYQGLVVGLTDAITKTFVPYPEGQ
jgi:hypothetical protein